MESIVEKVQERYGQAALRADEGKQAGCGCDCESLGCCGGGHDAGSMARAIGYSDDDLATAGDGNLGLGCGNPLGLAAIVPGMTVLDLGSGAGFDAFLAAARVGRDGRVIGVDMTPEMLALARKNAQARGVTNVEFRAGRIEALPVEDASVDLVISNCVINLSTDKPAVFKEIARVLKPGGALSVSDLVLVSDLPDAVRTSVEAYVGCVAGAAPIGLYLTQLFAAGFAEVAVPRIVPAGIMVEGMDGATANGAQGALSAAEIAQAGRALVSATFVARRGA